MKTLLCDRQEWDLCLDSLGNIALASNPYSIAQDAASAIKLFEGELWYDTTKGVPHFSQILGHYPALSLVKKLFDAAAFTVPEVAGAETILTGFDDRTLSGQVHVTDSSGTVIAAVFNRTLSVQV